MFFGAIGHGREINELKPLLSIQHFHQINLPTTNRALAIEVDGQWISPNITGKISLIWLNERSHM